MCRTRHEEPAAGRVILPPIGSSPAFGNDLDGRGMPVGWTANLVRSACSGRPARVLPAPIVARAGGERIAYEILQSRRTPPRYDRGWHRLRLSHREVIGDGFDQLARLIAVCHLGGDRRPSPRCSAPMPRRRIRRHECRWLVLLGVAALDHRPAPIPRDTRPVRSQAADAPWSDRHGGVASAVGNTARFVPAWAVLWCAWAGIRAAGRGIRAAGRGIRAAGRGIRAAGRGIRRTAESTTWVVHRSLLAQKLQVVGRLPMGSTGSPTASSLRRARRIIDQSHANGCRLTHTSGARSGFHRCPPRAPDETLASCVFRRRNNVWSSSLATKSGSTAASRIDASARCVVTGRANGSGAVERPTPSNACGPRDRRPHGPRQVRGWQESARAHMD